MISVYDRYDIKKYQNAFELFILTTHRNKLKRNKLL